MTGAWVSSGVAVMLLLAGPAFPGPPRLSVINPPAAQRGVESRLQFVGQQLGASTELVLPFAAEVRGGGSIEAVNFTIKPAAGTPPGVYPVRLRTAEGISNLRLLTVTDVPVILGKEPNGRYVSGKLDLEQTQRIDWPCVIAGGRLERDVDAFRFAVPAGQRLTFVTETHRLGLTPDPVLRLRDATGRTLAYVHDTPGLHRDERLDYTFEKAGEYILEVQSFGGAGWNNHYLVKIGPFDYARAVFPLGGQRGEQVRFEVVNRDGKRSTVVPRVPADPWLDQWRLPLPDQRGSLPWPLASGDLPEVTEDAERSEPQPLQWPVTVNGRIAAPGQEDLYRLAVRPGQHVRVVVHAFHLGSCLDGYLLVYDPVGKKLLAKNDDQGYRGHLDPALTFEVPAGVEAVVVALRDTLGKGGAEFAYRLTVERGGPDFFLWLGRKQQPTNEENVGWYRMDASDTLNLPPGQAVKLLISARRDAKADDPHYTGPVQGLVGPIRLRAENVPAGVTVQPAVIAEGKTETEIIVLASDQAPRQPFEIVIIGEADGADGQVIRRIAERRLYISDPQMTNLPWNWRVTKVTCVRTAK